MPKTSEVFGVSPRISKYSYYDRSSLDKILRRMLSRNSAHIAIKGPSKCGKSWLRQKCLSKAILVQCHPGMSAEDIYAQALSSIGIRSDVQESTTTCIVGGLSGQVGAGIPLLVKGKAEISGSVEHSHGESSTLNHATSTKNLQFVADSIKSSGARLVIEDFHYLSHETQETLAFHLKSLWDFQCNVIIIGVWSQMNLLIHMNSDLSERINEISVSWTDEELRGVLHRGCKELNIEISHEIEDKVVEDSFGNVGILQSLMLRMVEDEAGIEETQASKTLIEDYSFFNNAAEAYATQLDGLYQQFARRLSSGIRKRKKSTGIYALSMEAIVHATDKQLIDGFSRDDIFDIVHKREPRIQKGNLKTVLKKLVELQENKENPSGSNLVISYDEQKDMVFAVDRQLLFYRTYHTTKWPWEEMVEEATQKAQFEEEENDDE